MTPEAFVDIHCAYIEAGADVIGTNTFVGSSLHLKMAGQDEKGSDRMVRVAVEHAKKQSRRVRRRLILLAQLDRPQGPLKRTVETPYLEFQTRWLEMRTRV